MIALKRFLEGEGLLQECLGTRARKANPPDGHGSEARRIIKIAKALLSNRGG